MPDTADIAEYPRSTRMPLGHATKRIRELGRREPEELHSDERCSIHRLLDRVLGFACRDLSLALDRLHIALRLGFA